ncbi:MAG: prolyl oligopeptidase family serine peptidase [Burkholderiales bacterium]|nr:prolyl oligopeptidase family serine peptidase [Burkholderiales bacterium]
MPAPSSAPRSILGSSLLAALALLATGCEMLPMSKPAEPPKPAVEVKPPVPPVPSYPAVPIRPVTDNYHGTQVVDPYRYMEDLKNPEVQAIMKAQNDFARGVLDRIPGRAALAARINELSQAGVVITGVKLAAGRVFYFKLAPGDSKRKLYVRDGMNGPERLLVDPDKVGSPDEKLSIDWFVPSPDGRHVAYGTSPRGNEDSTLRIVELGKGNDIGIVIPGTRYGRVVSWHPNSRELFYNKLPPPEPGAALGYVNSKVYRHQLGKHPNTDTVMFGIGESVSGPAAAELIDIDIPQILVPRGSTTALAIVQRGDENERTIYAAPLASIGKPGTPWKKIVDRRDQVVKYAAYGKDLFVVTHRQAMNRKVLRLALDAPDITKAKVVVPETDKVVSDIAIGGDALYVKFVVGGVDQLQRLNFKSDSFGARMEFVRLKFDLAVRELISDPSVPGAVLRLEGWTEAPHYAIVEAKTANIRDTGLLPKSPVNFDDYDEVRLFARASDGQRIPVSMIYKKGTTLTKDHPTLLSGYGAYGITVSPSFVPQRMALLERGGIFATCHVRGGGEFGEMWHRGGQKANKNNTINDFIACAEFLIERGFTNPRKLVATGGSAGGITVGNALVRRPDLFAAVIPRVGALDMLRMETTPNGKPNVVEFGTVTKLDEFRWLFETSAFHNVKDKVAYPAVLLTTGANDPRVEPWNSLKFAARLQSATLSSEREKPVLLRLDYGAGHSSSVSRSSANEELADVYAFTLWQTGQAGFQVPEVVAAPATMPAAQPARP